MTLSDLAAGTIAGLACLTVTLDDGEPKPAQSVVVEPMALRIDGETVYYKMAVYRDCRLKVQRSDLIFRDRFEER